MSSAARQYILSLATVGMAISLWQLSQLPEQTPWLWSGLLFQAIITYLVKEEQSTTEHQNVASLILMLVGLVLVAWQVPNLPYQSTWLLLGFGAIAAVTHINKQEGPTARSSYQISFMVYGFSFVLLGAPATTAIIIVAHALEYTWGTYYPWYIQTFNIATFVLSITVAGYANELINAQGDSATLIGVAGIVLGLLAFTIVNHTLIGIVLKLARGQSFSQSGVFGFLTLMIDFSLLCMGAGTALLWFLSPFAAILSVIPLYLIHSTLRLPALQRQTETDPKTGIFNAGFFAKSVEMELDRAHRFERPLTVVMADLDLLRNINNTYGHVAGDVVLKGVAETLGECSREYDLVARFGGEEFAILMPETTPDEAWPLVENMRAAVACRDFVVSTSVTPIRATMSFGIAGRQHTGQSTDALIHCADLALYRAKQDGRNRTKIYGANDRESRMAPTLDVPGESKLSRAPSDDKGPATTDGKPSQEQDGQSAGAVRDEPETASVYGTRRTWPHWSVNAYIGAVTIIAVILIAAFVRPAPDLDWTGLLIFAAAAMITEALSVEIYLRDTAVSTSAAPLIAGALLFGPTGAAILGVVTAVATYIKSRNRVSRLIFNSSNFVISNMICVGLVAIVGSPITEMSLPLQIGISMVGGVAVYLSTTALLSGVVAIDTGESPRKVWSERFRWLAPYYIALGVVSFALMFTYDLAGLLGFIVILVPLFMLRFSQKQYIDHTREMVGQLRSTNTALTTQAEEISLLNEELLLTLARSVDLRDPHVMEHSKHVSRYASLTAKELGLSEERIELIRKAGLLHDIGKLGIPEAILFKPGQLSEEEFDMVKVHVLIGADLIFGCHSLHVLIPFVKHHHERFDGSGYPDGLSGDEIPLEARILGLADAVEAMASDRPYGQAMGPSKIMDEVSRCAGTHFDPEVTEAFRRVLEKHGESVIVNSARTVAERQLGSGYAELRFPFDGVNWQS